jgi:hypothetical protein
MTLEAWRLERAETTLGGSTTGRRITQPLGAEVKRP